MEHLLLALVLIRPTDASLVRRAALYDSHPEGPVFIRRP
jgi:hypothetical protein